MRNPRLRRSISLVVGAISSTTLAITVLRHWGESPNESWFTVVVASTFVTLFALVAIVVYHANVSMRNRLESGHRLLAKWTVSPTEWQKFTADESVRIAAGRRNTFKLRPEQLANGVHVIIAENAIMIDNDFYHLDGLQSLQWLPDTPPCFEYNMITAGKNGSVRWNVRFPVANGAEPLARVVWDYEHRKGQRFDPDVVDRRMRRMRVGGLIVGIASTPALLYAISNLRNRTMEDATVWALIIGVVGVPVPLATSLIAHIMLRSNKRSKTTVPLQPPASQ